MQSSKVIVIGAGITGLLIARLLQNEGVHVQILEARHRIGGRIFTLRPEKETTIEMGATWLGKKHHYLMGLLNRLNIGIKEQFMGNQAFYEPMSVSPPQLVELPPNEEPSYRIAGGTDRIIEALAKSLDRNLIHTGEVVRLISSHDDKVDVQTDGSLYKADLVVSTIPPKLLVDCVDFTPSLPNDLLHVASQTHTWMAESIKVALTFDEPFWREPGSSGTLFSNVGPVTEMYDHSNDDHFALKGFMNSAYHSISRAERKERVVEQLRRIYGDMVDSFRSYNEWVWQNEPFTFTKYQHSVIPQQNNGHPIYQKPFLNNRFLIAGSETAMEYPGYMDGAVESAQKSAKTIVKLLD